MESDFKKRVFDKIFFSFPICILAISESTSEVLESILLVGLENYKIKKYETGFCIDTNKTELTEAEIEMFEKEICFLLDEINFKVTIKFDFVKIFIKTLHFYKNWEKLYGKDSFCIIGKDLFQEVYNGNFDYTMFSIYCGISSILGLSLYARIVKKHIKFRSRGFKSETVHNQSGMNMKFISDKKLDRIILKMCAKKLVSRFTYGNRLTYYSIKIKKKNILAKCIKERRINNLRVQTSILDKNYTEQIRDGVEEAKQKLSQKSKQKTIDDFFKLFSMNVEK